MNTQTAVEAAEFSLKKAGREKPPVFTVRRVYTYADCLEWPENFRAEIINGDVFPMPAPSLKHQRVLLNFCFELELFVRQNPHWQVYPAPTDVRFFAKPDNSDTFVFEPDVVVIPSDIALGTNSINGVPVMLIEVLSPSTAAHDKKTKLPIYQDAGVAEVWLVDPEAETVETYVLENGAYTVKQYAGNDVIPCAALTGCSIALDRIFL